MNAAEIIKKVRRIEIRTSSIVNDVFAGHYRSVFKGQGMEFEEVREYAPGDDIRSIDWNVTARMGYPFIKKFREERELTMMLMVDVSASHNFGSSTQLKKDLAAELAAVLAFSATRNNDRVGLILFTDEVELYVPPAKGVSHVLRIIREVLYFDPHHKQTRLEPAIDFLNHVTTRRTTTFLISDFIFPDDCRKPLAITRRRHDLVGVLVGDKREIAWPRAGVVEWCDAETGESHLVDTSHSATRRMLEQYQSGRRTELLADLRRSGVDAIEVFAGEDYERELIKFFRMRERRLKT
jgi:uncharacterized protein (DUF58 family)